MKALIIYTALLSYVYSQTTCAVTQSGPNEVLTESNYRFLFTLNGVQPTLDQLIFTFDKNIWLTLGSSHTATDYAGFLTPPVYTVVEDESEDFIFVYVASPDSSAIVFDIEFENVLNSHWDQYTPIVPYATWVECQALDNVEVILESSYATGFSSTSFTYAYFQNPTFIFFDDPTYGTETTLTFSVEASFAVNSTDYIELSMVSNYNGHSMFLPCSEDNPICYKNQMDLALTITFEGEEVGDYDLYGEYTDIDETILYFTNFDIELPDGGEIVIEIYDIYTPLYCSDIVSLDYSIYISDANDNWREFVDHSLSLSGDAYLEPYSSASLEAVEDQDEYNLILNLYFKNIMPEGENYIYITIEDVDLLDAYLDYAQAGDEEIDISLTVSFGVTGLFTIYNFLNEDLPQGTGLYLEIVGIPDEALYHIAVSTEADDGATNTCQHGIWQFSDIANAASLTIENIYAPSVFQNPNMAQMWTFEFECEEQLPFYSKARIIFPPLFKLKTSKSCPVWGGASYYECEVSRQSFIDVTYLMDEPYAEAREMLTIQVGKILNPTYASGEITIQMLDYETEWLYCEGTYSYEP